MCWHNKDKAKTICPECGGKCHNIATRYFVKYQPSTDEYRMYADRICSDCANEWTLLERVWTPVDKGEKNGR